MIPNWLLGKSKSKLQEILGGGGGGTTYTAGEGIDITNHEISVDPLLMTDIEQTALAIPTKAAKTQISNPNILHNPWFQVNQRGFITGNTNGYCVDRWRINKATTGDTTYTLNSDGTITIDNSLGETQCYLIQRRTAKTISRVTGRKITASVMLSDGTVHSGSGTYVNTETTNYYEDDDIKLQSIAQTSGQFFALRVEAGKTITIKALKLEIGEISTLAMDVAPDMAIELAKCKRYYQRITIPQSAIIGIGFAQWAQGIRFTLPFDQMRTSNPSIVVTSQATKIGYTQGSPSAATAITSVGIAYNEVNQIWFQAIVSSVTTGAVYVLVNMDTTDMYFDLDAEL